MMLRHAFLKMDLPFVNGILELLSLFIDLDEQFILQQFQFPK